MAETNDNTDNRLGITRGEFHAGDVGGLAHADQLPILGDADGCIIAAVWPHQQDGEQYANARLIADAFNVANRTQKLPSEIERENELLGEALASLQRCASEAIYGSHGNAFLPGQMRAYTQADHEARLALNPQETP